MMALLRKYGFHTKKRLGQNFLINEGILDIIAEAAKIEPTEHIIEIGPGLGVLTNLLAEKAEKVTTIEIDKALLPILKETLIHDNITVLHEDALQFIPPKTPYKIVANIPYYITSPLISHFIKNENPPTSLTLLVQKEVGKKITTLDPKMSILSLGVALYGTAKYIKTVQSGSFFPAPKVDSAVIHITTHTPSSPSYTSPEIAKQILPLAKQAFSNKRKKLKTTILKKIVKEMGEETFVKKTGIDPHRRPETLSIKEWASLSKLLESQ